MTIIATRSGCLACVIISEYILPFVDSIKVGCCIGTCCGRGAKDDPPDETAFKNMQEIISTNLGGFNGLTKSAYAAQVEEIDRQIEEERKL
jgi:hypothetical protein